MNKLGKIATAGLVATSLHADPIVDLKNDVNTHNPIVAELTSEPTLLEVGGYSVGLQDGATILASQLQL